MALSRPLQAQTNGQDLQVALQVGSSFDYGWTNSDVGWRLRVESVVTSFIGRNRFPRAELSVNVCGAYDDAGNVVVPPIGIGEVQRLISPTTRLVIHDGAGGTSKTFLFDGYAAIDHAVCVGTPGAEQLALNIVCSSLTERLAYERSASIYGRHVKPRGSAYANASTHVAAMPCIFNRWGKPNRAKDLISINGGYKRPAFTYDGDPDAKYWTYADVIVYLIYAYLISALGTDYPIQDGNGFARSQSAVSADEGPQELTDTVAPTWDEIVKQKCPEMACEGQDIVSALTLWCEYSGCEMQQYTINDNGNPNTVLLFSVGNDGGPFTKTGTVVSNPSLIPSGARPLLLETSTSRELGTPSTDRSPSIVLRRNDVEQFDLMCDYLNAVGSVRVIGDAQYYECTIGKGGGNDVMKPGWAPDTMFGDNLSGDPLATKVDDIKDAIDADADGNSGTMFARYDRRGAYFASYASVGRLWVTNEAGEYTGSTYGRTGAQNAAWDEDRYDSMYDFHTSCGIPKLTGNVSWVPRRRPVSGLVSKGPGGVDRPPLVECSWDSGSHWYVYPGVVSLVGARDRTDGHCAVYLADLNLAEVKNEKPVSGDATGDYSVWEAIARGTFRIAITCCVQGDGRVIGEKGSSSLPHADFHMPHTLQFENRTAGNSVLKSATGWTGANIDDATTAASYAARKLFVNQSRRISGTIIIPWLTKQWAPGDLVSGIMPLGLSFGGATPSVGTPRVVKVHWLSSNTGQETHITIGDLRSEVRIVDGQGQAVGGRKNRR